MKKEIGMKAKTIKSVLSRKFKKLLESIDDPTVREIVQQNTIITGGSIASMLLSEKVNDYDLYFRTKDAVVAVAHYYVKKFKENPPSTFKSGAGELNIRIESEGERVKIIVKSAGIAGESGADDYQYFEQVPEGEAAADYVDKALEVVENSEEKGKPLFRPVFLTSNAITLSDEVQLVMRFYGEPEEIHKNYDFIHCTNYWTSWDRKLVLHLAALESLLAKELRYSGSKYPLCSLIRTRKFVARGWTINAGQYLKMAMQLNELNLNDVDTLEDQLMGVDFAYFEQVIDSLRERDKNIVDSTYLMQIIDKIF